MTVVKQPHLLVVCLGNICRSPLAAALLQSRLPDALVNSAGLTAVTGADMHPQTRQTALQHGIALPGHVARPLTRAACLAADLILVMDAPQRQAVTQLCPEARGKVFLLAAGLPDEQIPDPYRHGEAMFTQVHAHISDAVARWVQRLEQGL